MISWRKNQSSWTWRRSKRSSKRRCRREEEVRGEAMIYFGVELRTMMLTVLAMALLAFTIIDPSPRNTDASEAKIPAWQAEWEKTLAAAKKEGQVAVYISGYEEILPDFQKEYPEIKVNAVTGRGAPGGQGRARRPRGGEM